jgi:YD repeat-containing protein
VLTDTNQLGYAITYVYNASGDLTQETDRNGLVRDFTYDNLHRETAEKWMSGGSAIYTISYAYNADNMVTLRAFTIIDVLSIKIIDGRFAGRESVGRESGRRIVRGQSWHPAAKVLRFGADPEGLEEARAALWAATARSSVSAPGSALRLLLSRAVSSAQCFLSWGIGPWTRTVPFPLYL